jgi:nicotinamide-nucleotide amidase
MNCTIITIGDELLIGQTVDTNSAWIGQMLNAIGIKIYERIAVGDIAVQIVKAIDTARYQSDVIIITGGLGPTKDDITKKTLRNYFNAGEVLHEPTLARIRAIFEKRWPRPLLAINETQALVPDNCTVLDNERGTAPGMCGLMWKGKVIVSLPGVPYEMKTSSHKQSNTQIENAIPFTRNISSQFVVCGYWRIVNSTNAFRHRR